MKNIFLILLSVLFFTMFSCTKEVNKIDDFVYVKDESFVSNDKAFQIGSNINKSAEIRNLINTASLKAARYYGKRHIKENITLSDEKGMPYFYIFNYEDGGFSIVSADNRLLPIIAYTDDGYFSKDSLASGVVKYLDANALLIKDLRKAKTKQEAFVAQVYEAMECPIVPEQSTTIKSANSDCIPQVLYSKAIGPLLKTRWGQGCGYNTYCPALDVACNHALTGCATTAIAQVMAHWKFPMNYDYNTMSSTTGDYKETARLMGDLFNQVIDNYGTSGSSCNDDWHIRRAFLDFGYSSASLEGYVNGINYNGGYNYHDIVSDLTYNKPVILSAFKDYNNILGIKYPKGDGHVWVCDGYMSTQYTTYSTLMFSLNWGWEGRYNGWYAFNDWVLPNGSAYNFFQCMIYNIHP